MKICVIATALEHASVCIPLTPSTHAFTIDPSTLSTNPPSPLSERFSQFPKALASHAVSMRIGNVPCLLVHPDWLTKRPMLFWMHGRTANKELDAGRYLRCMRAGIACCAIDLPGHGERSDAEMQTHAGTLNIIEQAGTEIDEVLEQLVDEATLARATRLAEQAGAFASDAVQPATESGTQEQQRVHASDVNNELFDIDNCAIGGMSLGGMTSLARLCRAHAFKACVLECSTGWFEGLYLPHLAGTSSKPWPTQHDPLRVRKLDPMARLAGFTPLPVLAMHSLADAIVPWTVQRTFLDALRSHYARLGAPPTLIETRTWPTTGAPEEHSGFGKVAAEAKTVLTDFLVRTLQPT